MADSLVTGCSGYIGSSLAPRLRDRGYRVRGVDRNEPPDSLDLDDFVRGDLTSPDVADAALRDVDLVFHLAAAKGDWGISPKEYRRDNVETTRCLLEAAEGDAPDRWFFFSSVAAMGPSDEPVGEETPLTPDHPYGATKAAAERLFVRWSARRPDAAVTILRPSVVFGPGMPESTNIFRLIDNIHRSRFLMVGDGQDVKTTSYLDNLIAATLFLSERMSPGVRRYIYVDYPRMTTEQIVRSICQELRTHPPRIRVPRWLAAGLAGVFDVAGRILEIDFPITRDRVNKFCTGTNFRADRIRRLGFEQPVSCEGALAEAVDWYLMTQAQ